MVIKQRTYQKGMTLIEMMVTVTLLAILSAIVVAAFPAKREHEYLLSAEQQVQSVIRQAQQMALDQRREQECVDALADDSLCSKIGVAFQGSEVRFFADTNDDNRYDSGDNEFSDMRVTLSETVEIMPNTVWHAFIFEADPPTVNMWYNGESVQAKTDPVALTLRTIGGLERKLEIYPYAQVEVAN